MDNSLTYHNMSYRLIDANIKMNELASRDLLNALEGAKKPERIQMVMEIQDHIDLANEYREYIVMKTDFDKAERASQAEIDDIFAHME